MTWVQGEVEGPVVVIPAYKPAISLVFLVIRLAAQRGGEVIVVNDGSPEYCQPVFEKLAALPRTTILSHAVNRGKGEAIKTAIRFVLAHKPNLITGIVTADADGQHEVEDIVRVATAFKEMPSALWLGKRRIEKHTPLRNAVGNWLTRMAFSWLVGQEIYDTQTGLRGIPIKFLHDLVNIPASGYDFELEMLILAVRRGIKIKEDWITTVYDNRNIPSHFHPLGDSLKVFLVFLRFLSSFFTEPVLRLRFLKLFVFLPTFQSRKR